MTAHLSPTLTTSPLSANVPPTTDPSMPLPPLSPILLSHFPYLSLYNPFITAFPSILSTLASLTTPPSFSHPNPNYSKPFSEFLSKQESNPQCGRLKFRDWMLTIVQRCPRYLLLLKDLRGCTEQAVDDKNDGGEYERLGRVLDLVSKSKFKVDCAYSRAVWLTYFMPTSHILAQHLSTNPRPDSLPYILATVYRKSPALASLAVCPSRTEAPQARTAVPN
jgi:hypothetical protein